MIYSLSPWEIPRAPPLEFPSGSGYISPYTPPLVIIQIQCFQLGLVRDVKTYQLTNNVGVEKNPISGKIFAKVYAVLSRK